MTQHLPWVHFQFRYSGMGEVENKIGFLSTPLQFGGFKVRAVEDL